MSTAFTSVFNSHSSHFSSDPRFKFTSAPISYNQLASSSGTQLLPVAQNAVVKPPPNPLLSLKRGANPKRNAEELEIMAETAQRVKERLAQDQNAVLHPDADTPFEDELDAVNRLLPYHIFQQPRDDLNELLHGKGKEKAVDQEWQDERRETKFALECFRRKQKIIDRWRKANLRTAKRSSPDDQAYYLAQVVLDADRSENAWLTSELRTCRAELERIEREKRAAATAAATRTTQFSTTPQPIAPTMQTQYYRGYPYSYAQAYGTTPTAGAPTPASTAPTMATFPAAPAPTPAPAPPAPSPYLPNGAIPVQLPVASLPALHALGIIPVPATSLPPAGQPQPAAVLRGSTANGTLLSLEINVSLLQSTQMTGLAMVLNSLVAKTQNTAAATASAATAATSSHNTVPAVKQTDSAPS